MSKRGRISQGDLPRVSIERALRIPRALIEQCGGQPTTPLDLAVAVGVKPSSSGWRDLTGSAVGYGFTDGAYNSGVIGLTQLGRRAVAPQEEGDDLAALREACLKPSIINQFLHKYDGNKLPRDDIARNVLIGEFDIPVERATSAFELIVECAESIGAFRTIGGDKYVSLGTISATEPRDTQDHHDGMDDASITQDRSDSLPPDTSVPHEAPRSVSTIFVGHSKGAKVLSQVKQLLELADLECEVAVEQESTAIPVPDKVFNAMRRSNATIICVTADEGSKSEEGYYVNPNVLIEIGAAYVTHEKRLVLLWDRRVEVPSNLQGLYRCEFEGDELSWEAGTKLQKALIAIKKDQIPT